MSQRFDSAEAVRLACRADTCEVFPSTTIDGQLCCNLVMMEAEWADDFERFCAENPVSCPMIARCDPGQRLAPETVANNCDLCTDLRSYDLIVDGVNQGSRKRVDDLFTDTTVSFLIGSSVSFDGLLVERGWAPSWGPAIYLTRRPCVPVGRFHGEVAVTMRCFPSEYADKVAAFTAGFPRCHGGPIAIDDPGSLGIEDLADQHLAWPGPIPDGDRQLYWACGITPSRVAIEARLPWMVVHTPGNALVTDLHTLDLFEG